jgi:predicted ATPase/DNA-binding CsgD family transcriptional regulator
MQEDEGKPAHNLPLQFTSFIGRVREIAQIRRELARSRLVTLTGPGGIGKTRLALRAAEEEVGAFPDGIWFVDLAAVQDEALVPDAVARALGVRERPSEALMATLQGAIGERHLLLIVDNCEHLIARCAILTDTLLRACPELRIVSTSREALGIGPERVWRVPPMRAPHVAAGATLEELHQSEAVALFVERASAAQTEFLPSDKSAAAIGEICRRLDGIPLAIELAAARAKHLTIQQIAEHLDDQLSLLSRGSRSSPSRQQTLRSTIDWSYRLLSDPERLLFDRLSVFAGGWTLEAALAVCAGDAIGRSDVLDLLSQLVDKSLVIAELGVPERARYRTFETLHEYAREQLRGRGQHAVDATERRHVAFFVSLAERAHTRLGVIGDDWLEQLAREQDNFRAALGRTVDSRDGEHAERLAGALYPFWLMRGHLTEGRRWLSQAVQAPEAAVGVARLRWRARALNGLGAIAFAQGDYAAALGAFSAAFEQWREAGDQAGMAFAAMGLGNTQSYLGNPAAGRDMLEDGISAARQTRQPVSLSLGLGFLSRIEQDARNLERARQLAEEAVEVASGCGFTRGVCSSLVYLGDVLHEQGDFARADTVLHKARLVANRAGDRAFASYASSGLSRLALDRGDLQSARQELIAALGDARQPGERRAVVHAVEYAAAVAAAMHHPAEALTLASAAAAAREMGGPPMRPVEHDRLAPFLAEARASLSDIAGAEAWELGRTLALDQAVELALQLLQSQNRAATATARHVERPSGLSRREIEVLRLLAGGKTSKQIAAELVTSVHTVNNQISSIYAKIGASGKAEAVAFAIRSGLA